MFLRKRFKSYKIDTRLMLKLEFLQTSGEYEMIHYFL